MSLLAGARDASVNKEVLVNYGGLKLRLLVPVHKRYSNGSFRGTGVLIIVLISLF